MNARHLILPPLTLLLLVSIPQVVVPESIQQLLQQGNDAQQRGDYVEAQRIFNQVTELDSSNADAYIGLGIALTEQGYFRDAVKAFKEANEIGENATTYIYLGIALEGRGKRREAVEAYENAIRIDPGNAEAHNNLGNVLRDRGRLDDAVVAYQEAIRLDPIDYAEPYTGLGYTLRAQGKFEESLDQCDKALERSSRRSTPEVYARARVCMGLTLQAQGRQEEAIGQFQAAEEADPDWDQPRILIAEAERPVPPTVDPTEPGREPSERVPPSSEPSERLPDDPRLRQKRAIVHLIVEKADGFDEGTGWVIEKKGNTAFIVTCRHVVEGSLGIQVQFFSEPQLLSASIPSDENLEENDEDLEENEVVDLIKLEVGSVPRDVRPLKIYRKPVQQSDEIHIFGIPNWEYAEGYVKDVEEEELVIDASVGKGHSGSPVFNSKKQVIGVVSEVEPEGEAMARAATRRDAYAISAPVLQQTLGN